MKDYIPKKDSELASWSANFTAGVTSNAQAWEITSQELASLQTANTTFAALHAQADSPAKNSIIVAEKNTARKVLIAEIRALVNFRLRNPIITNAQRIALGLNVKDTTVSNIPVPTTRPELSIEVLDYRRLKIVFHEYGTTSKAKPHGMSGAFIVYGVLSAAPSTIADLNRSLLATKTPHVLEFNEDERGKHLYVAICWQNTKGEKGPWSEIEQAIIP